ncbi:MAG: hypothetical protein KJP03_05790 [Gammaproteobacteria bacterium]|nr:hypothetical protein [Gammaproteobacteria bacterium]
MTQKATDNFDQLIATYAPAGREQLGARRKRKLQRIAFSTVAAAVTAVVGATYLPNDRHIGFQMPQFELAAIKLPAIELPSIELPEFNWDSSQLLQSREAVSEAQANLREAQRVNESLAAELEETRLKRAQLTAERAALSEQHELVANELLALEQQRAALMAKRDTFAAENARLLADLESLDSRRADLGSTREQLETEGPRLTAEIADLRQKRQELDDERKRFRAQRQLLEHEISLLNEQKSVLQAQQSDLQAELETLQVLMEQVSRLRDARPAGIEPDESLPEGLETPDNSPDALLAAGEMMGENELGEVRGAINMGGKLDLSIGLTRAVTINGVEQYSSTLLFDGMTPVDAEALSGLPAVVVQNGNGNTADTSGLGANSGSIPVIIQNTLDNQHILNTNVIDVTIGNVGVKSADLAIESALADTLSFQD